MIWTKQEAAKAWARGILGTPAIRGMCKKRGWKYGELLKMRQDDYDTHVKPLNEARERGNL